MLIGTILVVLFTFFFSYQKNFIAKKSAFKSIWKMQKVAILPKKTFIQTISLVFKAGGSYIHLNSYFLHCPSLWEFRERTTQMFRR